MNLSDVVLISSRLRGLDVALELAHDLALSGARVTILEMTNLQFGIGIEPADCKGPFYRFGHSFRNQGQGQKPSGPESNAHFEVLLPTGPIAASGFWQTSSAVHFRSQPEVAQRRVDDLIQSLVCTRPKDVEVSSAWSTEPLLSDRDLNVRGQESRQRALDLGVRIVNCSEILDLRESAGQIDRITIAKGKSEELDAQSEIQQIERVRAVVWMLSREEALQCAPAGCFELLFENESSHPLFYWWRNRILWQTQDLPFLPRSFAVVDDILRPLSHHNLMVCNPRTERASECKAAGGIEIDVWSLLPQWSRTDAAYRDEHRLLSLQVLSKRLGLKTPSALKWLSPAPLAVASEPLDVFHRIHAGGTTHPKPRMTNVIGYSSEFLDLVGDLGLRWHLPQIKSSVLNYLSQFDLRSELAVRNGRGAEL